MTRARTSGCGAQELGGNVRDVGGGLAGEEGREIQGKDQGRRHRKGLKCVGRVEVVVGLLLEQENVYVKGESGGNLSRAGKKRKRDGRGKTTWMEEKEGNKEECQ